MLIVICIDWFVPAYKAGGPIQSIANMVEQLNDNSYEFKIFCSDKDVDGSTVIHAETDKWVEHNNNSQVWYSSERPGARAALKNEMKKTAADVLFVNGIYSWRFTLMPLFLLTASKKIVSVRGMLHPGALSQKKVKKKLYLSFWKLSGLYKKIFFHASTTSEKKYIQDVFGAGTKIYTAPNFPRKMNYSAPFKKTGVLSLVSVALISPMKNHLPVLNALMNVKASIEYNIYGAIKDNTYWNECLAVIKQLPQNIRVNYHGEISPGKVETVLQQNHVFILPSKSENFGHALYEALSAGKPLITSKHTPWNNLQENKAGINVDIEKSTDEIKNAVEYFATMEQYDFESWAASALSYSEAAIDLAEIKDHYKKMYSTNTVD